MIYVYLCCICFTCFIGIGQPAVFQGHQHSWVVLQGERLQVLRQRHQKLTDLKHNFNFIFSFIFSLIHFHLNMENNVTMSCNSLLDFKVKIRTVKHCVYQDYLGHVLLW